MSPLRAALPLALAALVSLASSALAAPAFFFRKVADDSTPLPGGTGTFGAFFAAQIEGNAVVFQAIDQSAVGAIYRSEGGVITRLIGDGDRIAPTDPSNTRTIQALSGYAVSGQSMAVSALVKRAAQLFEDRLLRLDGTTISEVSSDLIGALAIDGPNIAGVTLTNAGLSTRQKLLLYGANPRTAGPEVFFPPDGYGGVALVGTTVTYALTTGGEPGIFVGTAGGGVQIVTKDTPLPGLGGKPGIFGSVGVSGTNVVFTASTKAVDALGFPKNDGIFLYENGPVKRIVDLNTKMPGTNVEFTQFSGGVVSGGRVAFDGDNMNFRQGTQPPTQQGIYLHDGRALRRVVGPGSRVDGKEVAKARQGLTKSVFFLDFEGDSIAMALIFTDGSQGLYVATQGPSTDAFTVNSTRDLPDSEPGDGVASTGDLTPTGEIEVTLRAAMMEASAKNKEDTISFKLPGPGPFVISPASPLPAMTNPVAIDATSQPGYLGTPIVQINGAGAGPTANGIQLAGGRSKLRGLVIQQFGGSGIVLTGKSRCTIENCYIGTDVSGVNARPNGTGILVDSKDHTIGGLTESARNVISGNTGDGIKLANASDARILGNYIGTDRDGTQPIPNAVGIELVGGDDIRIGDDAEGAGNVISGNTNAGILVQGGADPPGQPKIEGNRIGTSASGTTAVANGVGIVLDGAGGATIGGRKPEARNIISGNNNNGVVIKGPAARTIVHGNYIGLTGDGTTVLGNGGAGILIDGALKTFVGGSQEGAGNIISGNTQDGVRIVGGNSRENFIQGNIIGLDATGATAIPNGNSGVHIGDAPGTVIGGEKSGALNVISGNGNRGVYILGQESVKTVVARNLIGTDRTGLLARANSIGVLIEDSRDILIGGPRGKGGSVGNVISGNGTGIRIVSGGSGSAEITIQDNDIGLSLLGATLPNFLGIDVDRDNGSILIGGVPAGTGNTIAFNTREGVSIVDRTASVTLLRNSIFATANGTGIEYRSDPPPAPVLTALEVREKGKNVLVGTFNGPSGSKYRIEVFANTIPDPSGFGEGETFVGKFEKTTNANGLIEFRVGVPRELRNFTATATEVFDSGFVATSGFSNVLAGPAPAPPLFAHRAGDARTVRFVEADGDAVTVRSGRGGTVFLGEGGALTLDPASTRGNLAISVQRSPAGDGRAAIGSLVVHGDLRRLTAPGVDFLGIRVEGLLGRLTIGDLLSGARLLAGGTPADRTRITARSIGSGASIELGSALDRLTADSARDAAISAPWVGELHIREGFESVTISEALAGE